MAAEAIEKKAKELGYQVKVETRGSGGAKNVGQYDGKSARRLRAKPSGGLCAVLP